MDSFESAGRARHAVVCADRRALSGSRATTWGVKGLWAGGSARVHQEFAWADLGYDEDSVVVAGETVRHTLFLVVPDNGVACTVDLDRLTFFAPDNLPENESNPCISENGFDIPDTDIVLEPGEFIGFTGINPPPAGFTYLEELVYVVSHEDTSVKPDGTAIISAVVCAEGASLTGEPVSDFLNFATITKQVVNPAIDVEMSVDPPAICIGDDQGDDVVFTYLVSIPTEAGQAPPDGNVALQDIIIEDDQCDDIVRGTDAPGNNNDVLELGEVWVFQCTLGGVDRPLTSTVNVSGTDVATPRGVKVQATDTVSVTALATPSCELLVNTPACLGDPGTASVPDAGPNADYVWTIEGADIVAGQGTPVLSYQSTAQSISISVTVSNADGCSCSNSTIVTVPQCTGACCLPNGDCLDDVTLESCESMDGTYQLDGSACLTVSCPQPKGACCFLGVSCAVLLEAVCMDAGGDYQGDFTLCIQVVCPQPEGACCLTDGTCQQETAADCQSASGYWQGAGAACGQHCPIPRGACCFPNGACGIVTQRFCTRSFGEYFGNDSVCADATCPDPSGACCMPSGDCHPMTQEDCLEVDGLYQGNFTECNSVDCPEPTGACCLDVGSCTVVEQDLCASLEGNYQGDSTLCVDPQVQCDPPPGVCCIDDGQCLILSKGQCAQAGGLYQGAGTICQGQCTQPKGACCFDEGNCAVMLLEACFKADGNYLGDDTLCSSIVCEQPKGACCYDNGSCAVLTARDCGDSGGIFQGDETLCNPSPCPQPLGGCCLGGGACILTDQDDCDRIGLWQGAGSTCAASDCPRSLGSCCQPDGQCLIATADDCQRSGGDYQGDLTDCATVACPQPAAACCFENGTCGMLSEERCEAFAGIYQGKKTDCDAVTCPQPTGACCHDDGQCSELSQSACDESGGVYQGHRSTCSSKPCPLLSGACCLPDATCLALEIDSCQTLGGELEANATCEEIACGACCLCDGGCLVILGSSCLNVEGTFQGNGSTCDIEPLLVDFEWEADFSTPLWNGRDVLQSGWGFNQQPDALLWISSENSNGGVAIFDTTPGGPNGDTHAAHLLVDRGNILILQAASETHQSEPGYFDRVDDADAGGTLIFEFRQPIDLLSIDLITEADGPDVWIRLTDESDRVATYHVAEPSKGYRTLELDDPLDVNRLTDDANDAGFAPHRVLRLEVDLGGSGGVGGLELLLPACPPDCVPSGACCLEESCIDGASEEGCSSQGGVYQGNDTLCTPDPCTPLQREPIQRVQDSDRLKK